MKTDKLKLKRPQKILVVDDHPMMRLGLRQFLAQEPDLTVCAEASNAGDALEAIERTRPDAVLMDITLEGRSGLDLLKDLHARFPDIPVLVHSMHDEIIYADRALRAGARGYLMKHETGEKLAVAVRQILAGNLYLSERVRSSPKKPAAKSNSDVTGIAALTPREFEVFRLIGRGNTNNDIARQLHVSIRTVEAHREHIKSKLNLLTSTALNLLAVRWENEGG